MTDKKQNRIENLKLEYQLTQNMAVHYDTINWAIGAILIAGIFNGLKFIEKDNYILLSLISFIILMVWRLFYKRHKDIQSLKFRRLHRIEKILHLQQHRFVKKADDKKVIWGVKGGLFSNNYYICYSIGDIFVRIFII